ncbi:hypothetical protein [Streptomyces sp. NPDC057403]|uniref:hypothetical protein n=1 Tax=Streptomyces sp. NPDC057403 TaxID=3346119 RepID=UPI0036955059
MKVRHTVRAVLLDDGHLVFLRRGWPGGSHYFRAEVLDVDPTRRGGPELDDPDTGDFSPVRVALDASAVAALALQPPELADYLCEHAEAWGGGGPPLR